MDPLGAVPGPPRLERGRVTMLTPGRGSCSAAGGGGCGATSAFSASKSMLSNSVKLSSSSSSEECAQGSASAECTAQTVCHVPGHPSTCLQPPLAFVQACTGAGPTTLRYSVVSQRLLIFHKQFESFVLLLARSDNVASPK